MSSTPLQALIFDVDGTLADTESVHLTAFNQAFAEFGLDWHWDEALYTELLYTRHCPPCRTPRPERSPCPARPFKP